MLETKMDADDFQMQAKIFFSKLTADLWERSTEREKSIDCHMLAKPS